LAPAAAEDGPLVKAAVARLERAGRLGSDLGEAALLAARRCESASTADTASGLAALLKRYQETMAEAVRDADRDVDALTDIRSSAALKLIRPA